jgi:hypothetical protein
MQNTSKGRPVAGNQVERIVHDGKTLAIIVRSGFSVQGIEFLTPNDYSLQLGYMTRPEGYVIKPHVHLPVERTTKYTQEVLFIRQGRVRVDFYSEGRDYFLSRVLQQGDVVLLICGGHGFQALETVEILEVKQGPYAEGRDKALFDPVDVNGITFDAGEQRVR